MSDWQLTIKKVTNGYHISYPEENEEGIVQTTEEVIEEDEMHEKKAITQLLERTAQFFGFQYDKYSKENLRISWTKKGHDVE